MRVLYLTLCVFVLDQTSKFAVKGISVPFLGLDWRGMEYAQSTHIFGNWCKITFIENPHMAFGLQFGGKSLLSLFAMLASLGIVWYIWKHRETPLALRIALALILAGAIGNLTDRIFYGLLYGYGPLFAGNVVDFVDLDLFTIRLGGGGFKFWPIFNIADSAVSIGVVMYLLAYRRRADLSKIVVTTAGDLDQGAGSGLHGDPQATSAEAGS